MDLSVSCDCGKRIAVSPSSSGSLVPCTCGRQIPVPKLSELRRNAGMNPFNLSVAEQLQAKFARGELPQEKQCLQCFGFTDTIVRCQVECEQPVSRGRMKGNLLWAILGTLVSATHALSASFKEDSTENQAHGHEVVVEMPLRLCQSCLDTVQGRRESIKELMRRNVLYAKLLEEYPQARIDVILPGR